MSRSILFLIGSFSVFAFSGCTHSQTGVGSDHKYSLYLLNKNGEEYIVEVNSLEEGTVDPDKEGIALNTKEIQRDLMVKNGFYYRFKKDFFFKYSTVNKQIEKLDSIHLKDFYLNNFYWIDQDTLLLIGTNPDYKQMKYAKINTRNMKASEGYLDIPSLFGDYNAVTVGVSEIRNGKLFMGYNYCTKQENRYVNGDTSYIGVFTYPGMQRLHIVKDTRSVYPGGENTVEPGSFEDETGNFYFLTCPGIALGGRPDKPTGILRIKVKEDQLDSTYFFNISSSPVQNHAYSIYYLGKGKALIRSERKDLYSSWAEHWKVAHYEFYVIDLIRQSVIKLNLPLDKGTRRQCTVVEDGKAYISLNSDTTGNFIWIYDIEKNALSKGLHLTGDIDFIMRIDKLSTN